MRQLKLFLTLLTLMCFGVGQMWAYTITFSTGSGDGTSASTSTACSTVVSEGASYLSGNLATATKVYYGGSSGLKLGTSSASGTIKMNLASNVTPTSIVVSAKLYNSSKAATLKVNGSTAQSISSNFSNLTFNITSQISYIELEGSKYCWIESITVNTGSPQPTCQNKVTVTKSSTSNGSFTLKAGSASGADIADNGTIDNCDADATIVLIPSANTNYHVDEVTASNSANITGPDASGNYTITYTNGSSISTTIGVTFEADPTYTVTWVAGNNSSFSTQTNFAGTALTDPGTPSADSYCPGGKVFKGWTATPIEGEQDSEPADLFTSVSGKSIPVNGTTYYAVFATENTSNAEDETITLDYSAFGLETSYAKKTATKSGIGFTIDQGYKGSGNVIQMNSSKGSGILYNTSAITGLKSITVNVSSGDKTYTITTGTAEKPTANSQTGTTGGTYNAVNGDTYFQLKVSGASYFSSVVIKYAVSSTTYSDYATSCCTPLGFINGSVSMSQTSATLTWDDMANVAASNQYVVTYRKGSDAFGNANVGEITTNGQGKKTCTITGLTCGTEYDFKIAVTAASGYCDKDSVMENNSTTKWDISYNLTNTVSLSEGPEEGSNACGEISATFSKGTSYTFPETITVKIGGVTKTAGTDYTWNSTTGALSIAAANVTGDIAITIAGVAPANPVVTPNPTALSFDQVKKGADVPTAKDIAITGNNLTAALTVTSSDETLYVVSVKSGSLTPDDKKAASPVITVTPQEGITTTAGDKNATITISGGGLANDVEVNVTFNVQETYTVNWYVNGNSTPARTQTDIVGTDLTDIPSNFSTVTDCVDKVFMGWATSAIAGSQDQAPANLLTNTEGMKITAENKDYYAVFATVVGEEGYEKVTDASVLTAGDKIVITNGGTQAMKAYVSGNNCGAASIVLDEDRISSLGTGVCEFTLGGSTGAWTFFDGTYYLYDAGTSSSNNMKGKTTKDDACDWVITISEGSTKVKSRTNTTKPDMQYNSGSSIFSCYNNSQQDVTLYRKISAEYSAYVTTCPHITSVTLSAGTAEHGSISFEKCGTAVTSVRTDGESAVEVDVIKTIDEGYELTGLTLTSTDVTGAAKNEALTKITIPAGADGTLTVTPTITLIPKYSITFANGGADGGTAPTAIDDQYAGTEITLPANKYTYTDHNFVAWEVTNNSTSAKIDIVDNKFTMPAANVTITAQWEDLHQYCALTLKVNGGNYLETNIVQDVKQIISDLDGYTDPAKVGDYDFLGWAENEELDDVENAIATISAFTPTNNIASKTLYAVFTRTVTGANKTDVLTADDLTATSTSYVEFSNVQKNSPAKYAGKTAKNGTNIQINEKAKQGIYSSVSGGILVSVTINMTAASTGLGVYGSNTGFTGYTSIPSQDGVSTIQTYTNTASKTITPAAESEYKYVGITSSGDGGKQISSISITWQPKTTYYTTSPSAVYDVTYNLGTEPAGVWKENEGCDAAEVKGGQTYNICTDVPERAGFKFVQWLINNQPASGTITISSATEIVADWEAKTKSNVTYKAGTGTGDDDVVEDIEEGTEVTLKAIGSGEGQANFTKSGYTFQGWKYDGKLYEADASFTMPAADVEFVAQWRKTSIIVDKMSLITDASALATGMQVAFGCSYGESDFAMAGDITSGGYMASKTENISLSDGVATYTDAVVIMTLEQVENGWKIRKDETNYLTLNGSDVEWNTQVNATVWTISINANNVIIANGNHKIQFNSGSPRFKTYTSTQTPIQLFGKAVVVSENTSISDLGYVEGEAVVASGENVTLTIDVPTTSQSISAQNGATVVVNQATTTESLAVDEGSKIVVNAPTTTPTVYFSTTMGSTQTPGAGSELSNVTNITLPAGGEIIYDLTLGTSLAGVQADPNQWHAFTVPFQVDALNGVYDAETGEKLTNEENYAIMDYHGDIRANGGYGWKKFRGTMTPGTFYLMTVDGNTKTFRFKAAQTGTITQTTSMSVTAFNGTSENNNDKGWNGIGNPAWVSGTVAKAVYVLDPYSYEYVLRNASAFNFSVSTPFFYFDNAKTGATSEIEMAAANAGAYYAPSRMQDNEIKNVEISFGNEVYRDLFYISASEDALNEFEQDEDQYKLRMSNTPKVAQIMGNAYGQKMAKVYAPLENNQAIYDLDLYAPAAGTYSLSAQEVEGATLYVTYNGAIVWNLSLGDYEIDLARGTTTGYGLMLVAQPNQMPTGVDTSEGVGGDAVQKILLNGQLYILRDGHLFDAVGKEVK